jgi:hypothetical protein
MRIGLNPVEDLGHFSMMVNYLLVGGDWDING